MKTWLKKLQKFKNNILNKKFGKHTVLKNIYIFAKLGLKKKKRKETLSNTHSSLWIDQMEEKTPVLTNIQNMLSSLLRK